MTANVVWLCLDAHCLVTKSILVNCGLKLETISGSYYLGHIAGHFCPRSWVLIGDFLGVQSAKSLNVHFRCTFN